MNDNQQIDLTQLPVAVSLQWQEAFGAWLYANGRRPNTINAYLQDLRHFEAFFRAENGQAFEPGLLNAMDVKKYFARQDEDHGVAPTSRNRRLATLRVLVQWAVEIGALEYDPTVAVKRQAVELTPRDLDAEQVGRLNAVVQSGAHIRCAGDAHTWLALRDRVLWSLFVYTGLRIHEVAGLNVGDVDFDERKIRVLGKGGKKAHVNVPSVLMEILASWIGMAGSPDAALIRGWKGERITAGQVRVRVQMIGEAAGIPSLNPHDLRHTYAYTLIARLLEQGLSQEKALDAVRKQMRHGDIKTTLGYFRARESQIRAAVEAM